MSIGNGIETNDPDEIPKTFGNIPKNINARSENLDEFPVEDLNNNSRNEVFVEIPKKDTDEILEETAKVWIFFFDHVTRSLQSLCKILQRRKYDIISLEAGIQNFPFAPYSFNCYFRPYLNPKYSNCFIFRSTKNYNFPINFDHNFDFRWAASRSPLYLRLCEISVTLSFINCFFNVEVMSI